MAKKNKVPAAASHLSIRSERKGFTIVYNDFMDSQLLDCYEKMVFIAIKRFANNDTLMAFPSLNRLHQITGISKSKIQSVIASLEQKGVLKIEHRMDAQKGHQSNEYTLYDFGEIWKATDGEIKTIIDQTETQRMIDALEAKGYTITKEKEPEATVPVKATVKSDSKELKPFNVVNNTKKECTCQDFEEYSLAEIKRYYNYDILVNDYPGELREFDSVINILHDILNTSRQSIRIGGEDKPRMIVIGRLLKLTYMDIRYAVKKYREQTERINNPRSYMLTILYYAAEQGQLDVTNQVVYDMAHRNDI